MNSNTKVIVAVAVVAVAVGVFFVMADSNEVASPSQTNTETQVADTQLEQAEADQVFEVGMQNFSFSEEQLSVNAGDTVTVNLTNNGGTHDFVIDELDVQSQIIGSGQTSVTFTVPEDTSGQIYSFYCSVGNHRELGMEGQLTVN
jgi:plastocyanin